MTVKLISVDWIELLCELRALGLTFGELGDITGIHKETLRGYFQAGSHPPHWRGEIIISVWCARLHRPREQLPMTEVYIAPRVSVPRQTRDRMTA